jgi:hypothetical protein
MPENFSLETPLLTAAFVMLVIASKHRHFVDLMLIDLNVKLSDDLGPLVFGIASHFHDTRDITFFSGAILSHCRGIHNYDPFENPPMARFRGFALAPNR